MTNPASSILTAESGVKVVPDLQLELECDPGVEKEMLGGRPLELGSEP